MLNLSQAVIYLIIIFTATALSFFGWLQPTTFLTACLIAFLMKNFKLIKKFKFWKLEAELKDTIEEANATLVQLKNLAGALAHPILSMIGAQGIPVPFPFSYKIDTAKQINQILQSINIPNEDIKKINQVYVMTIRSILSAAITKDLTGFSQSEIQALHCGEGENRGRLANPEHYEEFLSKHKKLTNEKKELIEDLRFFLEKGEIRRPKFWETQ